MHDVVVVGIPLIAILAGILFSRGDTKELRGEIKDLRSEMQSRFTEMQTRFNKVEDHLGRIDADLRQFYHLTGKLEARMDAIEKQWMQQFITDRLPEIQQLCREHHVQRMIVFGSAVRDDFNPKTSDVDVRVEFLPEADEDYSKNLYALHDTLPTLFGRKVDVVSGKVRNTYFQREIDRDGVAVYVA